MKLNHILGKTVAINYCSVSFEAIAVALTEWDDIIVMRTDGEGWLDDNGYVAKARDLGVTIPKNPTFWYVSASEVEGVMVPATTYVAQPVGEFIAKEEARLTSLPVIPAEPIEPTAPMTAQVLQMLRKKGDVTTIEAQGVLRCRSLSKRITELKRLGHKITRTLHEDHTGQRYARYILAA
ncbi:helix-turn-helix domain-containing protein [Rhizobium leguminosarum]|uniref:helix-turn-helix domain-containing protein n=1 Tax=Rhizobium leguminosarum TaxID=384 RepID=UPI001C95A7A3|nr:helix-turn-helix domain-containing protein [Rhizobium leguminosarum]MBY5581876.1 hypothetical protein [Rhizobium leguminosarum]